MGGILSKITGGISKLAGSSAVGKLAGFATSAGGGNLLASVAGPLAAGLIGGRQKSPQTDLVALRNNALAAGFNPLTALRATGGQGFITDPKLSTRAFIRDALTGGITAAGQYKQLNQQAELDGLKINLLKAEAANIGRHKQSPLRGAPAINTVANETLGAPLKLENGRGIVTNSYPIGGDVYAHPRLADAEIWEARGGDIMQELAGIPTSIADFVYSGRLRTIAAKYGREKADAVYKAYGDKANRQKSFDTLVEEITGDTKSNVKFAVKAFDKDGNPRSFKNYAKEKWDQATGWFQ